MLLRITNQCNQSCSHCFHESVGPKADHMSRDLFDKSIEFARKIGVKVILISGGEPTLNPLLFEFLKSFTRGEFILAIASNGLFASRKRYTKELLKLCDRKKVPIQITNDQRFYPRRLPKSDVWKKLEVTDHIPMVYPCRRVSENGHTVTRTQPSCFNLRSLGRRMGFAKSARGLEILGRFCTPAIGVDGRIHLGEADTCASIGTVDDPQEDIDVRLARARCSACGLMHGLPLEHREAVGEL